MKRLVFQLLLRWAAVCLASAALAQVSNTIATDAGPPAAGAAVSAPADAPSVFPHTDTALASAPANAAPALASTNFVLPFAPANAAPALASTNFVLPFAPTNAAPALASTNFVLPSTPTNVVRASARANSALASARTNSAMAILPANTNRAAAATNLLEPTSQWDTKIKLARQQRRQKNLDGAADTLKSVLMSEAPSEFHQQALYELALVAEDNAEWVKAEQFLAQYVHLYPQDPTVPEVLLREGLIYRQMGAHTLAVSKFYTVMSSALKLQQGDINYYKKLVIQAQTEIAETYFQDAQFEEAAEYFNRILEGGDAEADREQLECKYIRAISHLTNYVTTMGKAQTFLAQFPASPDAPEVHFLLASALKSVGRNEDCLRQVLLLLQAEQENVSKDPDTWLYWQRRAGNEIANQLYKEGDCVDALQIYLSLTDLDKSAAWQVPLWYQTGMVYEQLQQWQKAADIYTRILDRKMEPAETNDAPMLSSLLDMAKWRRDFIAWQQQARQSDLALHPTAEPPAAPPGATPEK